MTQGQAITIYSCAKDWKNYAILQNLVQQIACLYLHD